MIMNLRSLDVFTNKNIKQLYKFSLKLYYNRSQNILEKTNQNILTVCQQSSMFERKREGYEV